MTEIMKSKRSRTRTISGNSGKTGPERARLDVGLFMRERDEAGYQLV